MKKIGKYFLFAGLTVLIVSLFLIFNTSSAFALITLVLSVILNVIGLNLLMIRKK